MARPGHVNEVSQAGAVCARSDLVVDDRADRPPVEDALYMIDRTVLPQDRFGDDETARTKRSDELTEQMIANLKELD